MPRFAENAWNRGLAASIHEAACPFASTMPSRCCPPAAGGMRRPAASMVSPWQVAHLVRSATTSGCGAGGGKPWQVPQAACPRPVSVQFGDLLVPPPRVAPWQYVLLQVAVPRSQDGVVPLEATPANATVAVAPSTWPAESASDGFTW